LYIILYNRIVNSRKIFKKEEVFRNRKTKRGPKAVEKPPKVPGKIGRPRKEKPDKPVKVKKEKKAVIDAPKRGRGRPRKAK